MMPIGDMRCEIVRLTKSGGPLTKSISLTDTGKLKSDGSACVMSCGSAQRLPVADVLQLAALIGNLGSDQAIALGTLRPGLGAKVAVATKRKLNGSADSGTVISRSKEYVVYPSGTHGYVLLDYDSKGMPPDVCERVRKAGGFWRALLTVVPELAGVARVERASTSAGLRRRGTGEPVAGSDGVHVYLAVQDVSDSVRFLKALHQRCWLAGLGWFMLGRGGQFLERAIVDRMVGAPERLVFEGAPVLDGQLEQDAEARRPRAFHGDMLDTLAICPPLGIAEDAKLKALLAQGRQALAGDAAKVREKFVSEQADEIVKRTGNSRAAAIDAVKKQCEGVLLPELLLPFDDEDLAGKTVADVLADPVAFEGETLADPVEGIEYGRGKALIMRRADGTLWIHSFAHGRTVYELKLDAAAVRVAVERAEPAAAVRTLIDMMLRADVADEEEETLVKFTADRAGVGTRPVVRRLKKAREERAKREKQEARERRLAERDDPRPLLQAPEGDAEITPVMKALNAVLSAARDRQPPARNVEGYLSRVRRITAPEVHAFMSAEGSDEQEGAPQWRIHQMADAESMELVERHIEYEKEGRAVHLGRTFIDAFRRRDDMALPTIAAIATLPLVLGDGHILCTDGLDRERGIFFVPDASTTVKMFPSRKECTRTVVGEAMRYLLDEWICDVDTTIAGKCTAIAIALTIMQRSLLDVRPAFWVIAGRRGSGKTTTLQMLLEAVTGIPAVAAAWSPNEEERRKSLHSYLMAGLPYILYDNIPRGAQISCPHIERALTSKYYEDRKLGVSEAVRTAATSIILFTGNNVGPRGDLVSRSLQLRLAADRIDPENRTFRHTDPLIWTRANRMKILCAFFTIMLGNPVLDLPHDAPMKTRFKLWYRLVGSAIEHAVKCMAWTDPNRGELPDWDELVAAIDFGEMFIEQEGEDEDSTSLAEALEAIDGVMRDRAAASCARYDAFKAADLADIINAKNNDAALIIRDFLFPARTSDMAVSAKAVTKKLKAHVGEPVRSGSRTLVLKAYNDPHEKVLKFNVGVL